MEAISSFAHTNINLVSLALSSPSERRGGKAFRLRRPLATSHRRLHRARLFVLRPLRRSLHTTAHRRRSFGWAMPRYHFRDINGPGLFYPTNHGLFSNRRITELSTSLYIGREIPWQQAFEKTEYGLYGGRPVMAWGAICSDSRSFLVIIRGSLSGENYQLFSEHLFLRAEQLGPH